MNNIDPITLSQMIDDLLRLKESMVRKEIDASSCRTDRDWKRFHAAEESFENKYGEVMDLLNAG